MENNTKFKAEGVGFSVEINLNEKSEKKDQADVVSDLTNIVSKDISFLLQLGGKKISVTLFSKK